MAICAKQSLPICCCRRQLQNRASRAESRDGPSTDSGHSILQATCGGQNRWRKVRRALATLCGRKVTGNARPPRGERCERRRFFAKAKTPAKLVRAKQEATYNDALLRQGYEGHPRQKAAVRPLNSYLGARPCLSAPRVVITEPLEVHGNSHPRCMTAPILTAIGSYRCECSRAKSRDRAFRKAQDARFCTTMSGENQPNEVKSIVQ